jgi:hypothetical protein
LKSVRVSSHLSSKLNQKKPIYLNHLMFHLSAAQPNPNFCEFFLFFSHISIAVTQNTLDLTEIVVVEYWALRELRMMLLLSNLNYKFESKRLSRSIAQCSRVKTQILVKYQISVLYFSFIISCSDIQFFFSFT